jgi:hypothetical protein
VSGANRWTTPCTYREDRGKKDQGRAFLDGGSTPSELDEDGPAIMVMATPIVGKDVGTCKTPSK